MAIIFNDARDLWGGLIRQRATEKSFVETLTAPATFQLPAPDTWCPSRKDFWNHPNLWDEIDDPHKQMCWEQDFARMRSARPSPVIPSRPIARDGDFWLSGKVNEAAIIAKNPDTRIHFPSKAAR